MITIAFVNVEKGREDGRKFVEARKLARVAAESGLTKDALLKGAVDEEQYVREHPDVGAPCVKESSHHADNVVEEVS